MTEQSHASESADTSPPQWKRPLAAFAVVAIGGPIAGALMPLSLVVLWSLLFSSATVEPDAPFAHTRLAQIGFLLVFSLYFILSAFLVSGLQALLAGLWVAKRVRDERHVGEREAGLVSIAVSGVASTVFELTFPNVPFERGRILLHVALAIFTIMVGLICRWGLLRFGLMPKAPQDPAFSA